MSSILKALKKLEDEKTIRKPDSLKIDADILRGDTPSRFSPFGASIAAVVLFACGSAATYTYLKSKTSVPPAATATRTAAVTPAPATVPPKAVVVTPVVDTPEPVTISPKSVAPPLAPKPKQDKAVKSAPVATPPKMPVKATSESTTRTKPTAAATYQQPSLPVTRPAASATSPLIKVNGIAYQDGDSNSVAVVNGVSVSKGSVVEGVKVEEIFEEKVRFSYGGQRFEVSLGKSNR